MEVLFMISNINNSTLRSSSSRNTVGFTDSAAVDTAFGNRSKLSDEQYAEKIMAMARRDAEAGKNSKFERNRKTGRGAEWSSLKTEYTYAKSPNRWNIINNSLSGMASKLGVGFSAFSGFSLFDIIFKNHKAFGSADVGSNFVNFRDSAGNLVATFSNDTGWGIFPTDAENARRQDFLQMWDKAIGIANREVENAKYESLVKDSTDLGYM